TREAADRAAVSAVQRPVAAHRRDAHGQPKFAQQILRFCNVVKGSKESSQFNNNAKCDICDDVRPALVVPQPKTTYVIRLVAPFLSVLSLIYDATTHK
ncbi:unnamed protein product, partial [Mesorhabditis spiculigera]